MFRQDHKTDKRGGMLLFVDSEFQVVPCKEMAHIAEKFQESFWHWVWYGKTSRCLVGVVYRKPNSSRANDEELINMIQQAANLARDILVLGDFNLPEISWQDNTARNNFNDGFNTPEEFLLALDTNGLCQHVTMATRARGCNHPSLLDLVITSWEDNIDNLDILAPLGRSDHSVIEAELLFPLKGCGKTGDCKEVWNYRKGDYQKARELGNSMQWEEQFENKTSDEQYEIFVDTLKNIRNDCIPKKTVTKTQGNNKLWFNNEAGRLVDRKKTTWKAFMRAERLQLGNRDLLQRKYLRARRKADQGIRRIKREYEETLYVRIKDNPKAFYSYCNSKNKKREPVGKVKNPDGTATNSHAEAACALNKHFKSVFTVEDDADLIYANDFLTLLYDDTTCPFTNCAHYIGPSLESIEIHAEDILPLLRHLKPHKSPGPDELHPQLLSELADVIAKPLEYVFRNSLNSGKVPRLWKTANITAVHKKGPRDDVKNYRPISLTCICSKIMETLIRNQVMEHIVRNNILGNQQHGFSSGRSCLTNLLLMLEECSSNMDNKQPTDIIYLDFAKAFDTVPHTRLCHKLQATGIRGEVLGWLENFLDSRTQRVVLNGCASPWEEVLSGVPQGSVIGPTLFLIFIHDIASNIQSPVQIFADDTKIYRSIQSNSDELTLQQDLQQVEQWSKVWKLSFNTTKCQVLRMGSSKFQTNRPAYQLNEVSLANVTEQRDLGVLMDGELDFDKHVNNCIHKAYASWAIIRRTFESMKPKMFNLLYKTYVRPHVEYCPQAWSPFKKGTVKKLERVQRTATRRVKGLLGVPYEDRIKRLGLTTLEERRERGDLIETHKIMHNLHSVDMTHLFHLQPNRNRRNCLKIYKPRYRTVKRGKFFTQRVINKWNKLPNSVKQAETTNQFKSRYDKAKGN